MKHSERSSILLTTFLFAASLGISHAQSVLVEAESFENHGGWKLDTQFIEIMGSPYLLAHGLGRPVTDATTNVTFPETGTYHVYVRTKDWVAHWKAPGTPGRFQLTINGTPLKETFGTRGAEWHWHDGGTVNITESEVELSLRDLTGFDGRCDAIYFEKVTPGEEVTPPPNEDQILPQWRRDLLGLPETPELKSGYDLVVIGGGYSGMGAAISAARMGCKVALIQNRPVLGGNGSSEVRVWANGLIRRGRFPRIGEIVEEFADQATKSPGTKEEFGDDLKERVVRAEPNIDLFLNNHAYDVEMAEGRIVAVFAFDTRTSAVRKFTGKFFADCTGHGTIGELAGAEWDMTPKGRMGMSNMWAWAEDETSRDFPETPWALDLNMKDFPYPRDHHGQWFWESGFDKDPFDDAEHIRDWNLRAVYGAFNAMKNRDGADKHKTAYLTWIAFIGGPRESRRLLGDVLLTQEDINTKRDFNDGCVPSTWSIDLHYPKKQYAKKFPDNPFIAIAEQQELLDRTYGYPVPYRCFYSKNIPNLFMAGRNISVTHEALGTTRVMKTCGMMGEVVGKATWVCVTKKCDPRAVYKDHLDELLGLLELPGQARRDTPADPIQMPETLLPASPLGPPRGLDPKKLKGLIIDDSDAEVTGSWSGNGSLKKFVGSGYQYAGADSDAAIKYKFKAPASGKFELRLAYQNHANRAAAAPVSIQLNGTTKHVTVNMKKTPPIEGAFTSLGKYWADPASEVTVEMSTKKAQGTVHADAIQVLELK